MAFNVLMDMGKLKNPYCGLGQFSYHFGKYISKVRDPALNWHFLVPGDKFEIFGTEHQYEALSLMRRYLPGLCKKYDLWHALHQDSAYFPTDQGTPFVLTIHDLNFLEEKTAWKARRRLVKLQKKVDRASDIVFISKYTSKIAGLHLNLEGKDVHLIYNGVQIDTERHCTKPGFLPHGKYLFALGVILRKKNFHVLIDFIDKLPEFNLVIAGDRSGDYASEMEESIRRKGLQQRVILPGTISENDKIYLFKNCEAFLFPSKLEGFGLPVIEAMRFGKPVFLSKLSSLPEIGGSLAYYWEDFNSDHMIQLFKSAFEHYSLNQIAISDKIRDYAYGYNWEDSIRHYYDLYIRILNKNKPVQN